MKQFRCVSTKKMQKIQESNGSISDFLQNLINYSNENPNLDLQHLFTEYSNIIEPVKTQKSTSLNTQIINEVKEVIQSHLEESWGKLKSVRRSKKNENQFGIVLETNDSISIRIKFLVLTNGTGEFYNGRLLLKTFKVSDELISLLYDDHQSLEVESETETKIKSETETENESPKNVYETDDILIADTVSDTSHNVDEMDDVFK